MHRFVLFLVLGGLLAACASEPAAPPPVDAPTTQAPGPLLRFDTTGMAVFAVNRETGARVQLFENEVGETEDEGMQHALLSSFGPYVSYRTDWYYEGGAHPSYGTAYDAVVVRDSLREADLRELFPDDALLAALRQDSLVQAAGLEAPDLEQLVEALGEAYPCRLSVRDFFSAFAVRAIDDEAVVVDVGLTHGCEVERGTFTVITLPLPPEPAARALFGDLRVFGGGEPGEWE